MSEVRVISLKKKGHTFAFGFWCLQFCFLSRAESLNFRTPQTQHPPHQKPKNLIPKPQTLNILKTAARRFWTFNLLFC